MEERDGQKRSMTTMDISQAKSPALIHTGNYF